VEEIDIGGVTLLRAAAKNFDRVVVLSDPSTYEDFIKKEGQLHREDRLKLAQRVFTHTSRYDALIAEAMARETLLNTEEVNLPFKRKQKLRYGENPHQRAEWLYLSNEQGLQDAELIQGKELSYNNLLDLHACCELVLKMKRKACVAVKHNNPCGVGQSDSVEKAIDLALKADPISVFGGVVAVNGTVDARGAELLNLVFLECLIAPDFSEEALTLFSRKKNLRVLRWDFLRSFNELDSRSMEMRSLLGGLLIQQRDLKESSSENWTVISDSPSLEITEDLIFAEQVVTQLKSNAIAIVEKNQTLGLGMGQVNRVDAVEQAVQRMRKFHPRFENPVLASDAFFPFPDSIEIIAQAGIRWVLQPGGSIKDEEVIQSAKRRGVNLIFTGTRHFKH
jgi:phosphoribosylaminoimidazolecarboxamide formyltransferase/IMP cyclohydrolase